MHYQWDFVFLLRYAPLFWRGVLVTLGYTAATIVLGLIIGLAGRAGAAVAVAAAEHPADRVHRGCSAARRCWCRSSGSITRCRCCWASRSRPTVAAVMTLSCYTGAFYAEIFRGGIISIEQGQWDAARALGLRRWPVMRRVILPQAVRRMIPPFVNQSITQLKNTSLVSTIAVPDLLYNGTLVTADTYRPLEVYTVVALIYFALLFPSTLLAQAYERRLARAAAVGHAASSACLFV